MCSTNPGSQTKVRVYCIYLLLTFTSKYMEKYQKLPLLEDTLTNSFNNETFGIELKEDSV